MQDYSNSSIAISIDNHKLAALFFDAVLPLHSYSSVPKSIRYPLRGSGEAAKFMMMCVNSSQDQFPFGAIQELPTPIRNDVAIIHFLAYWDKYKEKVPTELRAILEKLSIAKQQNYREKFLPILRSTREHIAKIAIDQLILNGYSGVLFFSEPDKNYKALKIGNEQALELTIAGAGIVDTSKTGWAQIEDFRSDKDRMRKFRNFRLMLYRDFQGKSPDFIKDHIDKSIEDYQDVCKAHGLDLLSSIVTSLADSKSALGLLGISAAAILTGQPIIASAAAISGAVIETSKALITCAATAAKQRSFRQNHELAYLIELKKKFHDAQHKNSADPRAAD